MFPRDDGAGCGPSMDEGVKAGACNQSSWGESLTPSTVLPAKSLGRDFSGLGMTTHRKLEHSALEVW